MEIMKKRIIVNEHEEETIRIEDVSSMEHSEGGISFYSWSHGGRLRILARLTAPHCAESYGFIDPTGTCVPTYRSQYWRDSVAAAAAQRQTFIISTDELFKV